MEREHKRFVDERLKSNAVYERGKGGDGDDAVLVG